MNLTKFSKRNLFLLAIVFILLILTIVQINYCQVCVADSSNNKEAKIISEISTDDNFDDSSVIVVFNKKASKINQKQNYLFANNNFISQIEDLTFMSGETDLFGNLNKQSFRQILKLDLLEHSKENVIKAVRELEKIEEILWVGPNKISQTVAVPISAGGSMYSKQWGLHGAMGIGATEAWDITTGSRQVRVGVIDTGIANHPDLNANLVSGWDLKIIIQ